VKGSVSLEKALLTELAECLDYAETLAKRESQEVHIHGLHPGATG
jgi:hypothetical protein